jgi:hypothetical protein
MIGSLGRISKRTRIAPAHQRERTAADRRGNLLGLLPLLIGIGGVFLLTPAAAPAQQWTCPLGSVNEMIDTFRVEQEQLPQQYSVTAWRCMRALLRGGDGDVRAREVFDRLETLIRDESEHRQVRRGAAQMLAQLVGLENPPATLPEIMPYLLQLYEEVEYEGARAGLFTLGLASALDDPAIIPLMTRLATQPREEEEFIYSALSAVQILARMGEPGRAVLRRLHAEDAVRDWRAQTAIHRIAENDFRPIPYTPYTPNPAGLSAPELVDQFAREVTGKRSGTTARGSLSSLLQGHGPSPDAQIDSLLYELEALLLRSPDSRLRIAAASMYSMPGQLTARHPVQDMPMRIERLYRVSEDFAVQDVLLSRLPRLRERAAAVRIARRIALEAPEEQAMRNAAAFGIHLLGMMDAEGQTVLRELHAHGPLPDPHAQRLLEAYAEHDFRRPPPRVRQP